MEDNRFPFDSGFDDGVYGTGCTEPPKSHRAIVALLLVAVIFLGGISTALSVLNIKMFQKLNEQEATAIAYASADRRAVQASVPTAPLREEQTTVAIHEAPEKPESQEEGLSLQEIYEQNIPSVVSITASTLGTTATGTGVVLSGKGYLVTNYHVIEDAQRLTVRLTDERELEAAVVGTDPVSDLAVLYIRAENLTAAQFGDSDALRVGDTVVAIGDPLGVELRGTMTNGIVSAINRDVSVNGRTMNLIQTNAALNSGNSGGALFNMYGEVVGITNAKYSGSSGSGASIDNIGFAIPMDDVYNIITSIIEKGYIEKPYIGVSVISVSNETQKYGLPQGAAVQSLTEDGPAKAAGLQVNDIITKVNDTEITSSNDLVKTISACKPGDRITLTVYRQGQTMEISLEVAQKIQSATAAAASESSGQSQQNQSRGYSGQLPGFFGFGGF